MKIYHQSVFNKWPLEDNSVQAIITSPPYWGLRKYDISDVVIGGWKGQYGLEPSYKDYIEHTVLWAKEAWRVLRDDGVIFLNIGDSYSAHKDCKQVAQSVAIGRPSEQACVLSKGDSPSRDSRQLKKDGMRNKCKMLIPHRIAIALIDEGWILRNDLIWYKPNGMPESCKDRFSKKFEYIFMFVKSEKYYFDLDSIREPWDEVSIARLYRGNQPSNTMSTRRPNRTREYKTQDPERKINIKGKNPGDVWQINTQPSSEKHFAMWPEKLVERMIRCTTKPGDAVLDPFAGSGTTLRVAERLNRIGYGIDLGYQGIQSRRLNEIQKELI